MKHTANLRIALTVAALVAVPAIAPPPQLDAQQLFTMYEATHAQKLTVADSVTTQALTPTKYSATAGIQSLASLGTNYAWAKLVLMDGGWPMSDNNTVVILRWMRQENGTNNWWNRNNPLNNGYGAPGAGGTGSNATLIIAAKNVAAALHAHAAGGYAGIVAALAASSDPNVTAAAIWASNWSTSHYANGTHWSTVTVPIVKAPANAW